MAGKLIAVGVESELFNETGALSPDNSAYCAVLMEATATDFIEPKLVDKEEFNAMFPVFDDAGQPIEQPASVYSVKYLFSSASKVYIVPVVRDLSLAEDVQLVTAYKAALKAIDNDDYYYDVILAPDVSSFVDAELNMGTITMTGGVVDKASITRASVETPKTSYTFTGDSESVAIHTFIAEFCENRIKTVYLASPFIDYKHNDVEVAHDTVAAYIEAYKKAKSEYLVAQTELDGAGDFTALQEALDNANTDLQVATEVEVQEKKYKELETLELYHGCIVLVKDGSPVDAMEAKYRAIGGTEVIPLSADREMADAAKLAVGAAQADYRGGRAFIPYTDITDEDIANIHNYVNNAQTNKLALKTVQEQAQADYNAYIVISDLTDAKKTLYADALVKGFVNAMTDAELETAAEDIASEINNAFIQWYWKNIYYSNHRVPAAVGVAVAHYNTMRAMGHPCAPIFGLNRGVLSGVTLAEGRVDRDSLYSHKINPIIMYRGIGPCNWGNKTGLTVAAGEKNDLQFANVLFTLGYIQNFCEQVSLGLIGEVMDNEGKLWDRWKMPVDNFLTNLQNLGYLERKTIVMDKTNNNADTRSTGDLYADIYLTISKGAERIRLRFKVQPSVDEE